MSAPDLWNDVDPTLCPDCGRERCEDHLPETADAVTAVGLRKAARLVAVRALDLVNEPPPVQVIEGVAAANTVTVLVSESGAGKTFVLLDAEAAVAAGVPWHGRAVRQGSVVHVSFEGDALGVRLRALQKVQGAQLEHLHVIRARDPLSPSFTRAGEERSRGELDLTEAIDTLKAEMGATGEPPIVLIVVDTIRASLAGSEDSSEVVSAYLRASRRILGRLPDAAAILAHHCGWQDGESKRKRERGSSAWRGNSDATLYLEAGRYDRDAGTKLLTLSSLKARDAEPPAPLHIILRRVKLPGETDQYRLPVTSCIVEDDSRTAQQRQTEIDVGREKEAAAANHEIDLQVLRFIAKNPELCVSQENIRKGLARRKQHIAQSIGRHLLARRLTPNRGKKPYSVTEEGGAWLAEQA